MHKFGRRASSSSSSRGLTLIELLVTLVILSILAAAALPYAEVTIKRDKELELRRALRDIRNAINTFNEDWKGGKISKIGTAASDDGYPKTLRVLVGGAEATDAKGGKHKYLRRIPRDPFADSAKPPEEQWILRGYQDESGSIIWSGNDVYDVRSASEMTALDGTRYRDW